MHSQLPKHPGRRDSHGRATGSRPGKAPASVIPDKLYFRIGEVAKLCSVQTYVLRFWESEFPQLKPTKSGTGQRLYRKRDVEMALKIRNLLYEEGYTIPRGAPGFSARSQERSVGKCEDPVGAAVGRQFESHVRAETTAAEDRTPRDSRHAFKTGRQTTAGEQATRDGNQAAVV